MGLAIYEGYRSHVRRELFAQAPQVGLLFETKEHLAWTVLALAFGAGVTAWFAPVERRDLRRLAAALYLAAAIACASVVALGTYVASVRSFPH